VKRTQLERHLRSHGCWVLRDRGRHTIWGAPSGTRAPVPRHNELPAGTVRSVCRTLGIPEPPNPR
jgi:mRNA interferase HicA